MTRRNASEQREYVLDEYAYLRSWGMTRDEIAAKLHVQPESLRRAIQRAAERGDPRSDWVPFVVSPDASYQGLRLRRERERRAVA